jgi:glycerol-3-phosphate O-acyltransferase
MASGRLVAGRLESEPTWPNAGSRRVLLLVDASSRIERRLLKAWQKRTRPDPDSNGRTGDDWIEIPPSRRRRRRRTLDPHLEAALASNDDPLLAPIRVAWLPALVNGERQARLSDLLKLGDPRDPGSLRQLWVLAFRRDRCHIVAGEPAPSSDLHQRWRDRGGVDSAQTADFAEYVARQAALALERAERVLRGARYKVPRLVREEILERPAFRDGLQRVASETGIPLPRATKTAHRYLREIAAAHSPFVIDLVSNWIRWSYTRSYGEDLHYDREQLGSSIPSFSCRPTSRISITSSCSTCSTSRACRRTTLPAAST